MKLLRRFSARVTAEEVAEVVRWEGACIIENLVDPAKPAAALEELEPYIEAAPPGTNSILGTRTKRTGGLMGRSATARELIMHPLVRAAGEMIMAKAPTYHLMNTEVISIGPGEDGQVLHRDQGWQFDFPPMFEPMFSCMWPLTPFTEENGATRLILESHRGGRLTSPPEEETQQAIMDPGSVLLWTGSLYHGGGRNTSDSYRHGLNVAYCLGWLRPEENQFLAVPREVAATLPPAALRLMGYELCGRLGYGVDKTDPLASVRPELTASG